MNKKYLVATCVITLLATGCVTTNWKHPMYTSDSVRERQLTIDKARCIRVANEAAPMPDYIPVPQSGNYSFSGTANSYNMSTGSTATNFYGTARSRNNASSDFATGYNIGASIGAGFEKRSIFQGCMTALGWEEDAGDTSSTSTTTDEKSDDITPIYSLVCSDNTGFPINLNIDTIENTVYANKNPTQSVQIDDQTISFIMIIKGKEYLHVVNRTTGNMIVQMPDESFMPTFHCEKARAKF